MNYRLRYSMCPLHEEPLNYICLRSACYAHRVICAICREELHSEDHHTLPLKIYLSQKLQKLKCLTQTEAAFIEKSLRERKAENSHALDQIAAQAMAKVQDIKQEFQDFYDRQLEAVHECRALINEQEIEVEKLVLIEQAARAANSYEQYFHAAAEKITLASTQIVQKLEGLRPKLLSDNSWTGHQDISINRSIICSKTDNYKVAFLDKSITRSCKLNFKLIKSPQNWATVGVCHSNIAEERNFGFRYHTIGHGIYGISSNGAIWSHYRSDLNNKLGGPEFSQNQTVAVCYDATHNHISFQMESGARMNLEIDPDETGSLHFCVLLYYEGDKVEAIYDLS